MAMFPMCPLVLVTGECPHDQPDHQKEDRKWKGNRDDFEEMLRGGPDGQTDDQEKKPMMKSKLIARGSEDVHAG